MVDVRTDEPAPAGLGRDGYRALRREAGTHRKRLVVRLAGEAGLRPAEMVQVRPGDVTARPVDGTVHHLLRVRSGEERTAYLPRSLERAMELYASSDGIGDGEPLFDVTPRRVQMLVAEVAEAAATTTGRPALADVSTADLRAYHARSLLREGVDPRVVRSVGGWKRLDSLPTGPEPSPERVVAAFDRAEHGRDAGGGRFREALDRLDRPVALLDADGVVSYANRRLESAVDARRLAGRTLDELLAGVDDLTYGAMWEATAAGETWSDRVELAVDGRPTARLRLAALEDAADGGFLATFRTRDGSGGDTERTLERLGDVQAAVDDIDGICADASTHDGILEGVCETLAGSAAYQFAWVCDAPAEGVPAPRVWAGADEATIERVGLGDPDDESGPVRRAERDRSVRTAIVEDGAADGLGPWSLAAVPLVHGDDVYGTLVVATGCRDRPGEHERAILERLGGQLGHALAAVEWKRLLLADTILELEFRSEDEDSLFVAASAALDCSLRVEGLVPLEGDALLSYVTVSGGSPERTLDTVIDLVEDARLIASYSDESLLEVTLGADSLVGSLVDLGGNVQSLVAESGTARLRCEFAPTTDVRSVVGRVGDGSPTADFVAKRDVERSARAPMQFQRALEERLTDRQRAVLQAAYHAGYFDWPRGSTAEELADSVGVSSPTLHNHLRRAERKLLAAFFDDADGD